MNLARYLKKLAKAAKAIFAFLAALFGFLFRGARWTAVTTAKAAAGLVALPFMAIGEGLRGKTGEAQTLSREVGTAAQKTARLEAALDAKLAAKEAKRVVDTAPRERDYVRLGVPTFCLDYAKAAAAGRSPPSADHLPLRIQAWLEGLRLKPAHARAVADAGVAAVRWHLSGERHIPHVPGLLDELALGGYVGTLSPAQIARLMASPAPTMSTKELIALGALGRVQPTDDQEPAVEEDEDVPKVA